ncbi:hypothetical protein AAHB94_24175 [Bacillus toyonensis]
MKYFEFNKYEYWALVAAESVEKACEVYAEEVTGESALQVSKEGAVTEILKLDAHEMYRMAIRKIEKDKPLDELTNDFASLKNTTVLITSELT